MIPEKVKQIEADFEAAIEFVKNLDELETD